MKLTPKSKRPLIGITTGELRNLQRPDDTWSYGQTHYYTDVIESNGGVPFLIPSTGSVETIDGLYDIIDGILLAGGNDINPKLYRQKPHPAIEDVSLKRDNTEIHLLKRAKADKFHFITLTFYFQWFKTKKSFKAYPFFANGRFIALGKIAGHS